MKTSNQGVAVMLNQKEISRICQSSHFNGNVLIAKGKEILFQGGFGLSDIANKKSFTNESVFRIGSITKQFTALCILQLAEQGRLHLDDPIHHYIDGVDYEHVVTIHHLLSNCSGIPNFDPFGDYADVLASDRFHERMIKEVILKPQLNFTPGERFEYSSSGFFILTYIIEIVSGITYDMYLKENVFSALGMNHSGFHFIDTNIDQFVCLYELKNNQITEAMKINMRIASGAGGMYSTTYDLYLWGRGLIENRLISDVYSKLMFSNQTPINHTGGYGYGILSTHFEKGNISHTCISHPGNGPGVFAQNMIIDLDIQIILISNINDKHIFHDCFNQLNDLVIEKLL